MKGRGRVRTLEKGQCGKVREEVIVCLIDSYGGEPPSEEERAEASRNIEQEIARQRAEKKRLITVIVPSWWKPEGGYE